MKRTILGLGFAMSLTASCSSGSDDNDLQNVGEERSEITGGSLVLSNVEPYSSSVKLFNATNNGFFCSGVKIAARRFLTAGHCISGIDPKPGTGARVTISNSLAGTGGTTVGVDRFYPHPTFSFPGASDYSIPSLAKVYDIAILDVKADTPSIPSVATDSTAFGDGWVGDMVSYGCDNITPANGGKKQTGEFTSSSLSQFQSQFVLSGYSHTNAYSHYMVFDGVPRFPGAPPNYFRQGCPGDSGGPTFRFDTVWRVAGINSHIATGSLTPPAKLTWTTRVSGITSWLSSSNKIKGAPGSLTNALMGKCLGVNGSIADNAPVVQELCADKTASSSSQFWTKEATSGGYVRFINGWSSKCMHRTGTSIVQRTCVANDADQRWLILVGSPSLTPLINSSGAYAGVQDAASPFGSVTVTLGADEGTTRMRWVWTS